MLCFCRVFTNEVTIQRASLAFTVHESRRNSVSLNKGYISNNTLHIPNYDPTPNISIINNLRDDSYIVHTTFSNQDNNQNNRNIVTNNNKSNTTLFNLRMRKYPEYDISISLIF
jgi:hypothetical protein